MEFKALEKQEAQAFVDFFDTLVAGTDYLLPTIEEAHATKEKQEARIEKFNDFKHVFIAKDEEKVVGFLGVSRMGATKEKHIANFAIGVLPDYRGQHIATSLFDMAEKWLKEKGVVRLEMTVITENAPAIALYKKLGFKQEGLREKSVFMNNRYYDELYMSKFL